MPGQVAGARSWPHSNSLLYISEHMTSTRIHELEIDGFQSFDCKLSSIIPNGILCDVISQVQFGFQDTQGGSELDNSLELRAKMS